LRVGVGGVCRGRRVAGWGGRLAARPAPRGGRGARRPPHARANGVADALATVHADALDDGVFDIVLANILATPLIGLASRLAGLQRSGGRIVLSGILADQADSVIAAYRQWYVIDVGAERDGWVRLDGTRR
jgi:ribosomal protein L11 methyltransferase